MNRARMTDEELDVLLAKSLSYPRDIVPPADLTIGVMKRIDAWEESRRASPATSVLARIMAARMRNGEPVAVLMGAALFAAFFVGLFLAGGYVLAVNSATILRCVQFLVGPDLDQLRSLLVLGGIVAVGTLILGSLALSERLFGVNAGSAAC